MKKIRHCVFPKDVQQIIGKTERSSARLLDRIRSDLGKAPHQYITDEEFAAYTGTPLELVRNYIQD